MPPKSAKKEPPARRKSREGTRKKRESDGNEMRVSGLARAILWWGLLLTAIGLTIAAIFAWGGVIVVSGELAMASAALGDFGVSLGSWIGAEGITWAIVDAILWTAGAIVAWFLWSWIRKQPKE
jgi:hypothetical protein